MSSYLESAIKQFNYYKSLGDKTIALLAFEQLNYVPSNQSNSIAILIKHIAGNMLSRWTNFLTEDGEKTWRNRDEEFLATYTSKKELITSWENGWKCLLAAIKPLKNNQLEQIIYIRNQGHTVTEAINRQLCHYSYHVGQIVFIGKLIKNDNWQSLSIPKDQSITYNQDKFNQQKQKRHFTDDL